MKIISGVSYPRKFKIGAWIIRWWEDSPASHSYTAFEIAPNILVVYHAIGGGTEFWGYSGFEKYNQPIYEKEFDVSDRVYQEILSIIVSKLKTKYSRKHLFGLFIKRFVQYVFKKIISNPFKDGLRTEVCVETSMRILGKAALIKHAEDPEDMGIFEILSALKESDGQTIIDLT